MPWRANVVYSTVIDSVIEAFARRGPGDALYVVRDLDPHVDALVFLGLELPSGFFAPHERSFDWARYAHSR